MKARRIGLVALFTTMTMLGGLAGLRAGLSLLANVNAIIVGPVQFVETYFLAGGNLERRSPRVGEEFRVAARIRNVGPVVIYYLPTLCDTSLSAIFDPSYVKVETGRPRCLAASIPTPLKPEEDTTVSAPESGTAYKAIRADSTTVTVLFAYNKDANMNPSTQEQARNTIPFTIQNESREFPIPGFPIESLILGFALALGILVYRKRIRFTEL
jgi:hypothetical protein